MTRRPIVKADVPLLLELWLDSFHEKREAAELFFERNLSNTHGYLTEDNGTVIAAVYLVDCRLCGKPSHYLCGAATRRDRRGEGVMSALIAYALDDAKQRGDAWSVLLPADEGLYRFYGRLGYVTGGAVCRKELTAEETAPVPATGEPPWEELQAHCGGDKFLLWNKDFIQFAKAYYACYGVQALQNDRVFALYEQDGDRAEVFYALYQDMEALKCLLHRQGVRRFTLTGSVGDPALRSCQPQPCGMVKPLQPNLPPPDGVWIGLTLN